MKDFEQARISRMVDIVREREDLHARLTEATALLEKGRSALLMANVKDCDPCPNQSPTPIEECMDCRWREFTEKWLSDLSKFTEGK